MGKFYHQKTACLLRRLRIISEKPDLQRITYSRILPLPPDFFPFPALNRFRQIPPETEFIFQSRSGKMKGINRSQRRVIKFSDAVSVFPGSRDFHGESIPGFPVLHLCGEQLHRRTQTQDHNKNTAHGSRLAFCHKSNIKNSVFQQRSAWQKVKNRNMPYKNSGEG